ncbi:unnamed protein product [Effrenium voratum]|nr:unnamed protein product [Effrenium voratum]
MWPCDCLPELCSAKGRPIYDTLRRLVVDSVRSGALELSVLRLNFNPSRSFQQVYKVGPRLGNGSFGSVHLCKRRATGEVRAVKMLLKAYTKEFVANEIEILTRLDHPNVLRFYEFFEDSRSVLAVMEYCDGGDFSTLVPKKGSEEVRVLYRDVMLGLAYCHNFGIVHRDLKFNNCVLVHGPHRAAAKIIDFGLSAIRRADEEDTDFLREVQGTGGFVAPEVMSGHYGAKCDIWSFGIMVFMQLTQGTHPFGYDGRMDHTRLMHRIATQEPMHLLDDKGRQLVELLLVKDPAQRATAQDALQAAWLRPKAVRDREQGFALSMKDKKWLFRSLSSFGELSKFDKAVLLMASHLRQPELSRRSSDVFVSTDTDQSGFLNAEELKGALEAMGVEADAKSAEDTWRGLDTSEDGRVSHSEWLSATMHPDELASETCIKELFAWLDFDGDGHVSLSEIRRLVPDDEAEEVIVLSDTSKDGAISFEEFTELIKEIAARRFGSLKDEREKDGPSESEQSA